VRLPARRWDDDADPSVWCRRYAEGSKRRSGTTLPRRCCRSLGAPLWGAPRIILLACVVASPFCAGVHRDALQ